MSQEILPFQTKSPSNSFYNKRRLGTKSLMIVKKTRLNEEEDESATKCLPHTPSKGHSILMSVGRVSLDGPTADSSNDVDTNSDVTQSEACKSIDEPAPDEPEDVSAPLYGPHLPEASEASPPLTPIAEKSTVCPVALPNLGNTCYMNSVLQSIFSLNNFHHILTQVIKNCIKSSVSESDTLDGSHSEASEKDSILQLTSQLLSTWNSYERERERDAFQLQEVDVNEVLANFKSAVGNYNDQFHSNSQQDAVEFVELILDTMTDEFKKLRDNLCTNSCDFINPLQLFKIELKIQSTCASCGHAARLPNIISNTLYLNIPSGHEEGTLALQDVVDSYFIAKGKTEQNCDQKGCDGSEKLLTTSVGSLPKYLAVQLGRYTMVGEKIHTKIALHPNIWLPKPQKSDLSVTCNLLSVLEQTCIEPAIMSTNRPLVPTLGGSSPIKKAPCIIDSAENCHPTVPLAVSFDSPPATPPIVTSPRNSCTESPVSTSPRGPVSPLVSSPILRSEGVEYNLTAVICHRGSTRDMGHYYAFVRNGKDDNWYSCDDDTVKCLPFDEVVSASRSRCYCFFFEQAT